MKKIIIILSVLVFVFSAGSVSAFGVDSSDGSSNGIVADGSTGGSNTMPPVIELIGSSTVTVGFGTIYEDAGASSTDDVDGVITPTSSSSVNTSHVGTYNVVWTATDSSGNSASVTRTVIVADQTAPVITINGSSTVTITAGDSYVDSGATAFDLVDGTTTVSSTSTVNNSVVGSYTVTYTATDHAGNTATATRTVNVVAAPVVTTPVVSGGGHSSGGSSRGGIAPAPLGQVLGAQSVNWANLSASERADIIKQLLAQLAEIVKLMNAMIADGTLK